MWIAYRAKYGDEGSYSDWKYQYFYDLPTIGDEIVKFLEKERDNYAFKQHIRMEWQQVELPPKELAQKEADHTKTIIAGYELYLKELNRVIREYLKTEDKRPLT